MSDDDMVFLGVVDNKGALVGFGAAEKDYSLNLYRSSATQARKLKGDVRQAIVDKETADKLLAHAHVALMEGRETTFDELMKLVVGSLEGEAE
jgi:hypothetical protein